jgi:predicted alpha/beta superfamily hydrolase
VTGTVEPPLPLGAVEVHDLWSEAVGDHFRVFVGHCGQEPQAALFVTDGNGLFGTAVDTVRMMQIPALLPAVLVVGIGYPGAATIADTIAIRARDLTPTPSRLFPGSGGAGSFLEFIRGELVPWVGERWPSAGTRSVYFGHSLGGLFGVHALLTEPATFDDLIISSPSLWWGRKAPLTWEEQWAIDHDDLAARVYVGIGGHETDEGRRLEAVNLPDDDPFKPPALYLDMVADVIRFADALRARRYPSLVLDVDVFPGEFHATVAPIVLNRGLRALLGPA